MEKDMETMFSMKGLIRWKHVRILGLRSISKKLILRAKANSKFDLQIKEVLHINWRKPKLNAQQNHLALTLSL